MFKAAFNVKMTIFAKDPSEGSVRTKRSIWNDSMAT